MRVPGTTIVIAGATVSLVAAAVVIVGALTATSWTAAAAWGYTPPLIIALALTGGLRRAPGRWWTLGLVFSLIGDALAPDFLTLLGAFLLAHVCYLIALWRYRAQSWWLRPPMLIFVSILAGALVLLLPAVGAALVVPVISYAVVLTLMAVLATASGRPGTVGGFLFVISDLTLAATRFVIDIGEPAHVGLVIGTYVPAQVLLLIGLLRLEHRSGPRVSRTR